MKEKTSLWVKKKKKKKRSGNSPTSTHIKCIRLGSVRSSHLPFKMNYVRSSLHVFAPTGE